MKRYLADMVYVTMSLFQSRSYLRRMYVDVSNGLLIMQDGAMNNGIWRLPVMNRHFLYDLPLYVIESGSNLLKGIISTMQYTPSSLVTYLYLYWLHSTRIVVRIEGTLKQGQYCSILQENLLPFAAKYYSTPTDVILQQDNCGPHKE